ncbi:MAG TPA: hypothetical protein VKE70_25165 [Candidatus Solibacter sp.]|jgi:hypothetical protein|nr:hypothetical protein [Candidatus Solibacter sp.]
MAVLLAVCGADLMGDSTIATNTTATCVRNTVACMLSAQAFDFSGAWWWHFGIGVAQRTTH